MSNNNEINAENAFNAIGAVPLTPIKNTKEDSFFETPPKQRPKPTIIIIVSFILIILAIICMGYIVNQTNYSQMHTNLIIIVTAIIAVTTVLIV